MSQAGDDHALRNELVKGIWRENPVLLQVLGLCPAMAVTNSLSNAIVMGVATGFVLVGSSVIVSALRRVIPPQVRISIYVIIIATFVTVVDFALAAYLPTAHKALGAFIALIVVNCLILGRQEAFAAKNTVPLAIADAVGMTIGNTLALVAIGVVREVLGSGTLLGVNLFGDKFEPWVIMVLPPGGFITMGLLLFAIALRKEAALRAQAAALQEAP